MNKILYFFPFLLLTCFVFFQKPINDSVILSSLLSTLMFLTIFLIANIVNYNKGFFIFISTIYLLSYDILTGSAIGISIFSFAISSILYNFIKQNYKNNISFKNYVFIDIVCFLSLFLINYLIFNNLNIEMFAIQLALSVLFIAILYYFFGNYNKEENFMIG